MSGNARASIVLDLFERYYERVYIFARRSLDPAQAEDIAQEVFVRMLTVRDLEGKEISISYLLKVADNLIKRSHRRRRRLEAFIEREAAARGDQHTPGRNARQAPIDESGMPRAAEGLSRGERDALDLIVCRGMSYEAAAQCLDVRVSTINNWKFRGIQKLRQSTHAEDDQRAQTSDPGRSASHAGRDARGQRAG